MVILILSHINTNQQKRDITNLTAKANPSSVEGCAVAVFKNDNPYKYGIYMQSPSSTSTLSCVVYFDGKDDFIDMRVFVPTGGITLTSDPSVTFLSGQHDILNNRG